MRLKNTFIQGKLNKDSDERLLPKGQYPHAENIRVSNSEGSDVGAIENSLGNSQLTFVDVGNNAECIGVVSDESQNVIYYFVVSDEGSYLLEYDNTNKLVSIVLKDVRISPDNVLNLSKDYLITSIDLIVDSDNGQRFLYWTDYRNPPRRVNVEKAKGYTQSNFSEADISVSVESPSDRPEIELLDTQTEKENNIEQSFIRFAYRFINEDGQYSPLSPFSQVAFEPKKFSFDYSSSTNESMVNAFSAVKVSFKTGSKRVKAVEVVFKENDSNTIYLVERLNKKNKNWSDESTEQIIFSNNKSVGILPEKELFRLYDNVPRLAKAQAVINNRLVYGNYLENYNLVDSSGEDVIINFDFLIENTVVLNNQPKPSLKSNRDYEAAIVYLDSNNRMTTPLTSDTGNNPFIENSKCVYQNKGVLNINHKAPYFAKKYRIFVKQTRAGYDTIVPTLFYQDGVYVWIRLDGADASKIKGGDFIYVKADTKSVLDSIQETKVIEIVNQPSNFLEDENITDLKQVAGTYYKIRPKGFRINESDYTNYEFTSYDDSANAHENPIRGEVNVIEPAIYYGDGGLDDLTESGTYTGSDDVRYLIEIDSTGATDTFSWSVDSGSTYGGQNIAITGASQLIQDGLNVTFTNTTGHVIGDQWVISAKNKDYNGFGSNEETAAYAFYKSLDTDTIQGRANINITYDEYGNFTQFVQKSYTSSQSYANLEEWFYGDNIIDDLRSSIPENRIWFRRGKLNADGAAKSFTQDPTGDMTMIIKTIGRQPNEWSKKSERAKVKSEITIVQPSDSGGGIIFETKPEKNVSDIFYEHGKTYDIDDNGYHMGDVDQTSGNPAEITLDVFNCFSWGNGFESYKIKDSFNANSFSLQTRPLTPVDNYRENLRIASVTYSNVFEQTTNYNGLNEFNLSTSNYKDLDDAYGSIQLLYSRNTNLLVFQEDKVHYILVNKSVLFNADGSGNVRQTEDVLGQEVPYSSEFGISKNPESFAIYENAIYHTDEKRNAILRLSTDGYTEISNSGMRDFTRDNFSNNRGSKKLGAYDVYFDQYVLMLGDGLPEDALVVGCGNTLNKTVGAETFSYTFKLNDKEGEIFLNVTSDKDITVTANGTEGGLLTAGSNLIQFTRPSLLEDEVLIEVVTTEQTTYSIEHTCPAGYKVVIKTIVLSDSTDYSKQALIRNKVNQDSYNQEYVTMSEGNGISRFKIEIGISGDNKFPRSGDVIIMETTDDEFTSLNIDDTTKGNRMGYLVSNQDYQEVDLSTILTAATYPPITTVDETKNISFTALDLQSNRYIYMVYDFRDLTIDAVDDDVTVIKGESNVIQVLPNDVPTGAYVVTILTQPSNGTATVNNDNEIVYVHDDGVGVSDSLTYTLSNEDVSDTATVNITIIEYTSEFSISDTGANNTNDACLLNSFVTKYHDGDTLTPEVGDYVYQDVTKLVRFAGQNKYYKSGNKVLLIADNGEVLMSNNCSVSNSGYLILMSGNGTVIPEDSCTIGESEDYEDKYKATQGIPSIGDVIYNNQNLTSPLNGGGGWFFTEYNFSVKINTVGVIIDIFLC